MTNLKDIMWGSATSAYQVEGSANLEKAPSIWDSFSHKSGNVLHGDTGDVACNAYLHPEKLVEAASWLGLALYRMSVAWSRIIDPATQEINRSAISYYRGILKNLKARGIKTMVTLYHWDLPQWLQDNGGWANLETADHFSTYVHLVATEIGELVDYWIPVNEPFCAAFHGHCSGLHAPGLQDETTALRVSLALAKAHFNAISILKKSCPDSQVGTALNLTDLAPGSTQNRDLAAKDVADLIENRIFLALFLDGKLPDGIETYFGTKNLDTASRGIQFDNYHSPDFVGINYYEHSRIVASSTNSDLVVRGINKLPPEGATSANGVEICPAGFARVLKRVSKLHPELPIIVTENGLGLHDYLDPNGKCHDPERVEFIDSYLNALSESIKAGVNIKAYIHWALVDEYEWQFGYQLRYGLFYTDYPTGDYIPKDSATHYRNLINKYHDLFKEAV